MRSRSPGPAVGGGARTYCSDDDHELETRAVAAALARGRTRSPVSLDDGRGRRTELPPTLTHLLGEAADQLARGMAVHVRSLSPVLSADEVAEVLRTSRATVHLLIERGDLRAEQPGRHRYVRLADVLALRERRRLARAHALGAMAEEAEEAGLYDVVTGLSPVRATAVERTS